MSQCPIVPKESFLYDFSVQEQTVFPLAHIIRYQQAHFLAFQGTYWYHSHFRNQYCDGLRGPLIIEDPEDPQKNLYDDDDGEKGIWKGPFTGLRSPPDDTVITLADWYHYLSTEPPLIP